MEVKYVNAVMGKLKSRKEGGTWYGLPAIEVQLLYTRNERAVAMRDSDLALLRIELGKVGLVEVLEGNKLGIKLRMSAAAVWELSDGPTIDFREIGTFVVKRVESAWDHIRRSRR